MRNVMLDNHPLLPVFVSPWEPISFRITSILFSKYFTKIISHWLLWLDVTHHSFAVTNIGRQRTELVQHVTHRNNSLKQRNRKPNTDCDKSYVERKAHTRSWSMPLCLVIKDQKYRIHLVNFYNTLIQQSGKLSRLLFCTICYWSSVVTQTLYRTPIWLVSHLV